MMTPQADLKVRLYVVRYMSGYGAAARRRRS